MPKSHKPAGGRPARNFEPRRYPSASSQPARAASGEGSKPGSRSKKHRGYKPESPPPERKGRWARSAKDARLGGAERDSRAERLDRPERPDRFDGTERPAGPNRRGQTGGARFGSAPRVSRDRDGRGENTERSARWGRGDRPTRGLSTGQEPSARPGRDRSGKSEQPEHLERGYRPDRMERAEGAPSARRAGPARPSSGSRPARAARFGGTERPARLPSVRASNPKRTRDRGVVEARYQPADDVVLERLEALSIQADDVAGQSFADLGLGANIVAALAELGAMQPFPIQSAAIPAILAGSDVLARGRTGSGKTIAFGAPTVERLMARRGGTRREFGRSPRALILAPTRELALQIDKTVQPIARSVGLFTTQIFGGVPQGRQVGALQRGVDIVIGTPGRIEDLIEQRKLDLSQVEVVVLDEADHMCDLGFLEPVQRILRLTRADGQRLLFSATLDQGVAALVDEFLTEPSVYEVAGEDQASGTIEHRVLVVSHTEKRDVITQLADRPGKTLIFSRTRSFAEELADHLEDHGIRAVSLHGDLNQNRRTRNLGLLDSGRVNVLVATDVAARGIHVDDIDLVIQADAPDEYKTYLHRSGRTGRAGALGTVVTIIAPTRQRRFADLLSRAEIRADFEMVRPGDERISDIAALHSAEA